MSALSILELVAQAAARLNLMPGADSAWRGHCPACHYKKATLVVRGEPDRIVIWCSACGDVGKIAAIMGLPSGVVSAPRPCASKVAKALELLSRAVPAPGTPADRYLRGRGITVPIPASIRFLARQRNWTDNEVRPAMACLVERVPGEEDGDVGPLVPSGIHLTFLQDHSPEGGVRKAAIEQNKLTLGQLRHGGVWLVPFHEIGRDLAVAEGIETALSVMQLTGLPTVAALSAAGMRSFRWPPQVQRLWIAADNDDAGLQAAKFLLSRALAAGLSARIKVPAPGMNDFNDFVQRRK